MRIFLLDDDQDIRTILAWSLNSAGHEVIAAESLEEARRVWPTAAADCALLDLMLKTGLGVEFIADIRKTDSTLPILFLTGNPEHAVFRSEAVAGAVYSVLEKPVSMERLETMLQWAEERRREARKPSREELEKRVPKHDELKEMIVRAGWKGTMMYIFAMASLIAILMTLMGGLYAFQHRAENNFGFGDVNGFIERVEGYLRRDEKREIAKDPRNGIPPSLR